MTRGNHPTQDPWTLIYHHWDPAHQPLRETLCTLGNGYFRGHVQPVVSKLEKHVPGFDLNQFAATVHKKNADLDRITRMLQIPNKARSKK